MSLPEGFAPIDFEHFHQVDLPARLDAERQRRVAKATAGLRPLAFVLPDSSAWTYTPHAGGIDISAGSATAATVIELDRESWQGLVHELEAPAGLLYAKRTVCRSGNPLDLMSWESGLRALYNGRPPYDPSNQRLCDRRGNALDPQATFSLGDDGADMQHFLDTTGYLFVRGVFGPEDVQSMAAEAVELRREATPGDKLSWWGKNAQGDAALCRVTRADSKPRLGSLPRDARLLGLKDLFHPDFEHKRGEGAVTVIYKAPGMTEGLGDLPWHRDCGMGGHAVICPNLVASIYLTEATPESGELAMLPGSHRASFNAHDRRVDPQAYAAHFRAAPGDISLHYSDTVHGAPPPTDPQRKQYRISAILTFASPTAAHHRGERSYNEVLHERDDGQIEHLEETLARRR